jgi:tetratricopeptide (TPR) repeat protein
VRSFALLCVLATVAHAQPKDPERAAKLFEEGRELAKAGNYNDACARFTRSYELDPAIGTELNLADCIEHQGLVSRAWKMFDDVATRSEHDNAVRAKFARDRADGLLAKLGTVVVAVAEPGAAGLVIKLKGEPIAAAAELREHVDPGRVQVSASVPGKPGFAKTVDVTAGVTVTVEIPAFAAERAVEPAGESHRARGRVHLAMGVGGGGIVALAVSGILGLKARSDYNSAVSSGMCVHTGAGLTCGDPGARSAIADAGHLADIATGFFVGGAVLVAAGVTLFVTAPHEQVVSVTPMASTTGIGLVLGGRF